jgi:hypothetical protein
MIAELGNISTKNLFGIGNEMFKVELTLDGTPITDASLDLLALHSKYLSSISSKGCTKVDFELLSAMPLILLFIDDYKKLVLLHHELASSLLHAQLLLEKCFY